MIQGVMLAMKRAKTGNDWNKDKKNGGRRISSGNGVAASIKSKKKELWRGGLQTSRSMKAEGKTGQRARGIVNGNFAIAPVTPRISAASRSARARRACACGYYNQV